MARFTATWNNTEAAHWEPGDLVRTDYFQDEVGENVEHMAQTHNHDRDTANVGRPLVLNESDEILFRIGAIG